MVNSLLTFFFYIYILSVLRVVDHNSINVNVDECKILFYFFFVIGLLHLLPKTAALFIHNYFFNKITEKFGFDGEPNHEHFSTLS